MINNDLHASGWTGQGIQRSGTMWGDMAIFQLTTELFPPAMQVNHAITAFCIPQVFYWGCHTGTDPKQKWLQMFISQNNVPTLLA